MLTGSNRASKRKALTLALLCLAVVASAAIPARALDTATLRALVEEARIEMKAPGLRAAVRWPDGRIVSAAAGFADREAQRPLDDVIGMPGGSTGKLFTATLAMLLVEDGALDLDDKASKWLGGREWFDKLPNASDIRVRHLLAHSSGLADYPGTMCFQMRMAGRVLRTGSAFFEPEELIRCVRGKRARFAPGEGYRYTDAGYLVLGRIIEAAGEDTYYTLLDKRIVAPLELDGIRPQDASVLSDVATGYSGGGRVQRKDGRMKFDPRSEWTGGGLITTPVLLVRFVGALAQGRIVSAETLALMKKGGWRDPEEPGWHYGFGMFVYDDGAFGHAGRWPGYRTRVHHDTANGLTIAVQTNRDGRLDLKGLIADIAELAAHSGQPGGASSTDDFPPGVQFD